jgi:hypothetical protein
MTTTILVIESVVLVLLTVLVAGLLRSHAEILRRLHALGAGLDPDDTSRTVSVSRPVDLRADDPDAFAPAADVAGSGLRDDAQHVAIVGSRGRTLLAFLSSGCLTCQGFWDVFADTTRLDLPDDIRLIVVTKDAAEESISALRRLAPRDVPVVMSSGAWADYRVPGSPYFVLVDGALGRVRGEGTGAHWDQVKNLLRQAADDASDDSREGRIDRELLAYGIEPGDPSLYRTADQIAQQTRS